MRYREAYNRVARTILMDIDGESNLMSILRKKKTTYAAGLAALRHLEEKKLVWKKKKKGSFVLVLTKEGRIVQECMLRIKEILGY